MRKCKIQYSLIAFMLIFVLLIYPLVVVIFEPMDSKMISTAGMVITHSAVIIVITSAFVFFFKSKILKHVTPLTTLIALGLSAVGSLGLWALFNMTVFAAFGEIDQHPIRYPATMIVAPLSLVLFIALIYMYAFLRKKKFFCIGTLIDAIIAIIYVWPFFLVLGMTDGIISNWLAAYYDRLG